MLLGKKVLQNLISLRNRNSISIGTLAANGFELFSFEVGFN
jgi:hypothetical protein